MVSYGISPTKKPEDSQGKVSSKAEVAQLLIESKVSLRRGGGKAVTIECLYAGNVFLIFRLLLEYT